MRLQNSQKDNAMIQNLHTHTCYCDGKNTPEEMVQAAIEKGFHSLGFSGHSYVHGDAVGMTLEATQQYKSEIARLKTRYRDSIELFCGLEVEMYSGVETFGYDYLIGSVHCLYIDGVLREFDRDAQSLQDLIRQYFSGDGMAFVKAYYEALASMPEHGSFDILGHFDIISKHSEKYSFFDVDSSQYLKSAYEAVEALRGKIPCFEINTGAIARGYRTTPYPSIPILKMLLEQGFLPVITSDCHDKAYLDCCFGDCLDLLEACGCKERYVLTANGFQAVSLR